MSRGDLLLGPAAEWSVTRGEVVRQHDVTAALKPRQGSDAKEGQLSLWARRYEAII